ncbi:condensation domain-containing protein [Actinocorallia herbida]|uniref:Condensation domain-containing protein n=1 Tax=Actinocorallia herbida TaxID=58109 RepID=A0A3N1DBA6_9ACTN|nr:condensation domain-containing protein [Actinocorallia herbida]ROO90817.1 condensation domain-containing protein [Actinocorallia herbida]
MPDGLPVPLVQRRVADPGIITEAVLVFAGPLDPAALRDAAEAVCRAHEATRTTVDLDADRQTVHPYTPGAVCFAVCEAGRGGLLATLDERAGRPLDPARLPVFRVDAVTASRDRAAVHLALPHAVADYTSMEIVVGDLVTAYAGLTAGRPVRLAVPGLFTEHLRHRAALAADPAVWAPGGKGHRAAEFWADRLAGAAPPAFGRPRPGGTGPRTRVLAGTLEPEVSRRLAEVCREARCSPFHAAVAAFAEAVSAVTGEEDVTTMCVVHGRNDPEYARTVGMFIEEVPFRQRVRAGTRRAFLSSVAVHAFTGYVHAATPLALVAGHSPEVAAFASRWLTRGLFLQYRPQRYGAGLEDAVDGVRLSFPQEAHAMNAAVMPGVALFSVDHTTDVLTTDFRFDTRRWLPAEMDRLHTNFLDRLTDYALHPDAPVGPS